MQALPIEQLRMPITHAASNKTYVAHWKEPTNREGEKKDSIPSFSTNDEASNRHSVCDNQPYCTVMDDE